MGRALRQSPARLALPLIILSTLSPFRKPYGLPDNGSPRINLTFPHGFVFFCFLLLFLAAVGKDVEGFHGGDLTKLEQEKICFNFSDVNLDKKEFYSPNFPNNYPNNTKCELQLKGKGASLLPFLSLLW
ncbi:hypothetical protein AVEN_190937-1 [Araneus ventricosus]|uniref:CUB domain-containing protein n=1 Tax=Araneus ventricosus TaxID=182803 RepID=A0A4Y2TYM3_ARAVE|nr:hypothetical protein AVEN_190937-1 [Araneus ventricosus]